MGELQMGKILKNGVEYGGNSDYEALENKPQINGISLNGDKTASDLGLVDKDVDDLTNYYTNDELDEKLEDKISVAVQGSTLVLSTP